MCKLSYQTFYFFSLKFFKFDANTGQNSLTQSRSSNRRWYLIVIAILSLLYNPHKIIISTLIIAGASTNDDPVHRAALFIWRLNTQLNRIRQKPERKLTDKIGSALLSQTSLDYVIHYGCDIKYWRLLQLYPILETDPAVNTLARVIASCCENPFDSSHH